MVIKKEDLANFVTADQKEDVRRLEEQIDKDIEERYGPSQIITVDLKTYPSGRVRREIIKKYEGAGWSIKFESSQRDGNVVTLS